MRDELLASSAHIICIIHHGGHILYTDSRPLIEPFVEQGRLSVVVLGDHVRKNAQADVFDWAEKDYDNPWGNMFFKTLIPVCFRFSHEVRIESPAETGSRYSTILL